MCMANRKSKPLCGGLNMLPLLNKFTAALLPVFSPV